MNKSKFLRSGLIFAALSLLFCLICAVVICGANAINGDETLGIMSPVASADNLIIIDPGHGGEDSGAVGYDGTLEKELNLEVAKLTADILRLQGFNVVLTRTDDRLLYDPAVDIKGKRKMNDLKNRLAFAKENENSVFVSIHMNKFAQSSAKGLVAYYSKKDERSAELAEIIQTDAVSLLQPTNKRIAKAAGSDIYLLDNNECPAVLVECGFLSNPSECEKLKTEGYRRELALVIAGSIDKYISLGIK